MRSELSSQIGSSFLYNMVESARQWLENKPLDSEIHKKVNDKESQVVVNKPVEFKPTPKKAEVCRFYLQKKCKFGNKCHNLHPGAPVKTQILHTEKQSEQKSSECVSQPSKGSEETKEDAVENDGKKAPLRQAVDVISRILWDPDLQSEDFTIGYLDRFVGIIEKPFSAFSWEDLSTVGHNVLAVPKHRIQYFKYLDEIIWDKRSQMDNVFGSRGGKVITDIVPPSKPNATSSDSDNQEQPKPKPTAEIKLIGEDSSFEKGYYTDKDRPTHFVCIKVHNSQIVERVGKILHHICSCAPDLTSGCLELGALHVTLCMLRIESETQKLAAQKVLEDLQRSFVQTLPPSTELEFTGVGNFHGRLLYAKVVPHQGLNRMVSMLMEQLQNAGVRTPGNFAEYTPHMTLLKLSRPMQREAHTATIVPALYSKFTDMHLGTQKIDMLYLCSTSGAKVCGFYETLMTLPLSLICLPPSFVSILTNRISQLAELGMITLTQKDQLIEPLNGKSISCEQLDHTIEELKRINSGKGLVNHYSQVVILRGVPGSGKSHLAHQCAEYIEDPTKVAVCSADNFFTDNSNTYSFSTSQLHKAHLHCFDQYLNAVLERKELIIVDNTNSQLWEYQCYVYICNLLAIPYSILEVPCLNVKMLEVFRSRCVHKVDHAASMSMYERWEKDVKSELVPPKILYPRVRTLEEKQSFSMLSLCHPRTNIVKSTGPIVAVYTAVFLTRESQWLLLNTFPPTHPDIIAEHVTLAFEPSMNSLLHTKIGKRVKVKVISAVDDKNIQAAVVILPRGLSSENQIPHISLSKEKLAFSKDSNKLLECRKYIPMKDKEIILEGRIGVAVRKVDATNPEIILSSVDYHKIMPRIQANGLSSEAGSQAVLSQEEISICTGAQEVTKLFVFDFDLTLFNSADPKDGREIYEKATGKVWPHRGWLGHPDSLMPPLSVHPGPALADYHDHQGRAGSLTVVLTARIERTRQAVQRVLEEAQLFPDAVFFKPDSTSDSETSAQYKVRIIEKLIAENKSTTLLKFWDDKSDNLSVVKELAKKYQGICIEVIDASKIIPKKHDSALYNDLVLRGCHLSNLYDSAATVGINFLQSQYCKMIGYSGNPKDVCHVFGSYPIGRRSDIDMCCLVQSPASPFDTINRFAQQLQECGIIYIHKGMSSRCPRLKVKLVYDSAPPVVYDLIFAVVENDLVTPGKLFSSSSGKILSSLKPVDSRSKVALTGPNFLEQVIEVIDGKMSVGEFGNIVEMVVQILRALRQKGNAYHFIRTFHIVRLLMEYMRSPKFSQIKDHNCDEVFRNFIFSVSEIPPAKWQKLFGDFVPKEYTPRIIDIFATVSHELGKLSDHKPMSTQVFFTDFNSRPLFPPPGYTSVSLCLHGTSKPLLWKLASLVEARLQTCVRKLLDAGIDVVPDGNDSYEKFSFAIPESDVGSSAFKSNLKNLTDEIAGHEQEPLAHLKLQLS